MEDHTAASRYLEGKLKYIGIAEVEVITAGGMAQLPEQRGAIIQAADARAVKLAGTF